MTTYAPLIRYRARPFDGSFPITGLFGATTAPWWSPSRPHLGVDFGCPTGTPIKATTFGVVETLSQHDGTFGTYALIDCRTKNDEPTEWYDLHAHLSELRVEPGQLVEPGDVLGLSGETGFVDGAHLHWQTCRNNRAFPRDISLMRDPLSFPVESLVPAPAPPPLSETLELELAAFMSDVCGGMGWAPTPWRLAVLRHWADLEDDERWRLILLASNPLATTRVTGGIDLSFDNGNGPGRWNSAGVTVYRDRAAGVVATVETLKLSFYPNVRRSFVDQQAYDEALPELVTYIGSEGYARDLLAFMRTSPASKGEPLTPLTPLTTDQLNAAQQLRMQVTRWANHPDIWRVERLVSLGESQGIFRGE